MFSFDPPRAVLTPCIGVCQLDADGLCRGCHRTTDEIARWGAMGDSERLYVMNHVLPKRESDYEASLAQGRA